MISLLILDVETHLRRVHSESGNFDIDLHLLLEMMLRNMFVKDKVVEYWRRMIVSCDMVQKLRSYPLMKHWTLLQRLLPVNIKKAVNECAVFRERSSRIQRGGLWVTECTSKLQQLRTTGSLLIITTDLRECCMINQRVGLGVGSVLPMINRQLWTSLPRSH